MQPVTRRYLEQRTRFGMKLGLETMRTLLAEMGNPERAFASVLVAGTNGKGSVAAYLDAALRASRLRCGRYTSPHLVRLNERITVAGREITDAEIDRSVRSVRVAAERLVARGALAAHPTFFEVMTAAAFEQFRARGVEMAVLEVGLGGRLDATNVVEPLASAIVSLDFDHQEHLGHTLPAIASEKAGVFRRGRTTVLGPVPAVARARLERLADSVGARLVSADRGVRVTVHTDGTIDVRTSSGHHTGLRPLPGAHQRTNLLVALRLLEVLARAGVDVDFSRLRDALVETRWPGRLETVRGTPDLVLDGAHNPAGARALAAHLRGGAPYVLVFAAMADKDIRGLARALFPRACAIVLTRLRLARAAPPAEIARRAAPLARAALCESSVSRALRRARALARANGPQTRVVVAGSLYLVGAVRALLRPGRRGEPPQRRAGALPARSPRK